MTDQLTACYLLLMLIWVVDQWIVEHVRPWSFHEAVTAPDLNTADPDAGRITTFWYRESRDTALARVLVGDAPRLDACTLLEELNPGVHFRHYVGSKEQ